jgi:hypothetical protein
MKVNEFKRDKETLLYIQLCYRAMPPSLLPYSAPDSIEQTALRKPPLVRVATFHSAEVVRH